MAQNPQYTYSPLKNFHIRLLMIRSNLPSDDQAEIRCHIEHFEHSNAPPYYALSYAWGTTDSSHILLNDERMSVRTNLYDALWNLRKTGFCVSETNDGRSSTEATTKWIWIDALCIDQENIPERNHQVRFMGSIYKLAIRVLAWLGSRKDVDHGCHENIVYTMAEFQEPFPFMDNCRGWNFPRRDFTKCVEFFDRPYWQRMWIVQEIALARDITILYDDISISWDSLDVLQLALKLTEDKGDSQSTSRKILNSHAYRLDEHRRYRNSADESTLWSWMHSFRDSICFDPRDKVYALLGLAVDEHDNQLIVDYSKSLFEVYTDVINFYCSTKPYSTYRVVNFSQKLQQSFNRPSELRSGVEAYQKIMRLAYPGHTQALIEVSGRRASVIRHVHWPHYQSMKVDCTFEYEYERATNGDEREESSSHQAPSSIRNQADETKVLFEMDNSRIGYAANNILEGDIICQFRNWDIAAVLRAKPDGYQVVGRAQIAKSEFELEKRVSPYNGKYRYSQLDWDAYRLRSRLDLSIDIVTLQKLTACIEAGGIGAL
ncbi:hypothetical protein EG329_004121 [Mollisiaceae sp. DMI_Dod_QoI]|nr:hypothetical protein EG329_004121 [Helotiales sp. DMI_Dod_QoI]